jgi:hypothetical protein
VDVDGRHMDRGFICKHTCLDVVMDFGKSKSNWIFFRLDFVGLDYFGCGCPHAKLNWMSKQYWMSKHELLILLSDSGRGPRI